MKKATFILLLCTLCFGKDPVIEKRGAGIVTDFKVIGEIVFVETDRKSFIADQDLKCYISIGDSLFEYWIDYRKEYIGNKFCFLKLRK